MLTGQKVPNHDDLDFTSISAPYPLFQLDRVEQQSRLVLNVSGWDAGTVIHRLSKAGGVWLIYWHNDELTSKADGFGGDTGTVVTDWARLMAFGWDTSTVVTNWQGWWRLAEILALWCTDWAGLMVFGWDTGIVVHQLNNGGVWLRSRTVVHRLSKADALVKDQPHPHFHCGDIYYTWSRTWTGSSSARELAIKDATFCECCHHRFTQEELLENDKPRLLQNKQALRKCDSASRTTTSSQSKLHYLRLLRVHDP